MKQRRVLFTHGVQLTHVCVSYQYNTVYVLIYSTLAHRHSTALFADNDETYQQ